MVYGRRIGLLGFLILLFGCAEVPEDSEPNLLTGVDPVRQWVTEKTTDPAAPEPAERQPAPPVADMIAGLVDKLERHPDDRKGWELLARSYVFVGDLAQAKAASARAIELGADASEFGTLATDGEVSPN